jgi:Ca-activated chloride channel family protein
MRYEENADGSFRTLGLGGCEMSDDFDALRAALRAVPAADANAKAQAMLLAMENFDRLQGSTEALRPTHDQPERLGFVQRIVAMLQGIGTRQILTATTSVAALVVGFVVILPLAKGPEVVVTVEVPAIVAKDLAAAEAADKVAEIVPQIAIAEPDPTAMKMAEASAFADEAAPEALMQSAPAAIAMSEAQAAPAPSGGVMATGRARMAVEGYVVMDEAIAQPVPNSETFATAAANPVHVTAEVPVSTFSIDVDTASYAVVRSSLNAGVMPDPAAVRVEEMVNYFPYDYPKPQENQAFRPTITVMPTPWNPNTRLVNIAIQGAVPQVENRPPLNLVFLVDTSGSMDEPNKLPLLKQSLALMLGQLQAQDQVAIVAYAGSAGQVLPPTKATDRAAILGALDQLAAGGSTAGAQGLELAYLTAESMAAAGEVSRVLLATDGDFNVGIDDPEALKDFIAAKRETGVYLSVLGFGRGNLDDAVMQALAQNGNGSASYIDSLSEARKVLVDQLTGALYPIADNVKIQVEWNPAQVAEYRLIGYETRALAREDFNNDKVDAGDIGAGVAVTALYEVTAPGSDALLSDPLRYGKAEVAEGSPELGYLRLRSVAPGGGASVLQETPIVVGGAVGEDARFAAAIAGFGQLLTGGKYLGDWGWDQAIELGLAARGADEFGYRIEAVNLMRAAKAILVQSGSPD